MSSIFPKSLNTKQAVLATLAYFDLFEVPLTRNEISEYLFFAEADEEKIDIYLRESPLIHFYDGYYGLQKYPIFFQNFFEKQKASKEYWKRVRRYQWLFSICPFIELIAVCNSLPIRDIREDSDIDLFVVAKSGHLFTARVFLTLFTSIFRIRRHGAKTRKRFCLSFYVTEKAFKLDEIARTPYDIYLAYWIKTLEPISGDYKVYESMLKENEKWLEPYFTRLSRHKRFFRSPQTWQKKWKARFEKFFLHPKWEKRFRKWQMKRSQEKYRQLADPTGTIINENMLKFHDKDVRDQIRHNWVKRINSLL